VNGEKKSDITLNDFDTSCSKWVVRFSTGNQTKEGGGLTIFGEKFGNYAQNLVVREYYK
jgi:predicted transcriptional regulator